MNTGTAKVAAAALGRMGNVSIVSAENGYVVMTDSYPQRLVVCLTIPDVLDAVSSVLEEQKKYLEDSRTTSASLSRGG